jgi:hypothetical protein
MKVSNKARKRILSAVTEAFTEIVAQWPCYDSPPETWQEHERDRWDELSTFADLVHKVLEGILLPESHSGPRKITSETNNIQSSKSHG